MKAHLNQFNHWDSFWGLFVRWWQKTHPKFSFEEDFLLFVRRHISHLLFYCPTLSLGPTYFFEWPKLIKTTFSPHSCEDFCAKFNQTRVFACRILPSCSQKWGLSRLKSTAHQAWLWSWGFKWVLSAYYPFSFFFISLSK